MRLVVVPNLVVALRTVLKEFEDYWNSWKSEEEWILFRDNHCWDRPEYSEESQRFAVTETPVKTHKLMRVRKSWKEPNDNKNKNHYKDDTHKELQMLI